MAALQADEFVYDPTPQRVGIEPTARGFSALFVAEGWFRGHVASSDRAIPALAHTHLGDGPSGKRSCGRTPVPGLRRHH